jgi:DNA-binding protein YbaB
MRLSLIVTALALHGAAAFAPSSVGHRPPSTTTLDLFGGGGAKSSGGEAQKKGPGMMDQLAMFKKAQELAQKKKAIDDEIAAGTYEGTGADGKVKCVTKFVPSKNPMMEPNPDIDPVSFDFDDEWYESATPEELSAAVQEAITNSVEKTTTVMAERYQELQESMAKAFAPAADK